MTATALRRERAEALASQKERQLSDVRQGRKDADSKLQAMLNRISFLQSEESKLDRDIENARKRALEALARKAEKAEKVQDDDVLSTAKDILGALGPATTSSKPLRPTTGRSSLRSSIASSAGSVTGLTAAADAAASTSQPAGSATSSPANASISGRPGSAQRLSSSGGQPLKPSLSTGARNPPPLSQTVKRTRSSPSSPAMEAGTSSLGGSGAPPRPPSSTTAKRTPRPTDKAARVGGASPSSEDTKLLPSLTRNDSMQRDVKPAAGQEEDLLHLLGGRQQQKPCGDGVHKMDMLNDRGVDLELIEELIAGTSSAASGAEQQLQGLQQFSVESASKVVHVRAAARKADGSSAVVLAAGVGWGLGGGGGGAASVDCSSKGSEAAQMQSELLKKRQLRNVRKAFGLQPTPLHDTSAQVLEVGAGAWQ